jgi:glycosyltransferase involved in cell wall biosynthesis
MNQTLISICIPVYNGEKHLNECLNSIINQTYRNLEILIVDDCSSDTTIDICKIFQGNDKRIKIICNEKNIGLVNNWNKCIELSNGEWIKFVFQDDYLLPDCIEKLFSVTEDSTELVVCKRSFLLEKNADEKTINYYENEVVTLKKLGVPDIITRVLPEQISVMAVNNICLNFIGEPTSILFRKSVTEKIGLFNVQLTQICDLEFCLRIGTNYGLTYHPEALTMFRIHSSSTTSINIRTKEFVLSHIEPILLVRQLLFDPCYIRFRDYLNWFKRIKLRNYFIVRTYEAYETAMHQGKDSDEMNLIREKSILFPEIEKVKYSKITSRLFLIIVRFRRKIRLILAG